LPAGHRHLAARAAGGPRAAAGRGHVARGRAVLPRAAADAPAGAGHVVTALAAEGLHFAYEGDVRAVQGVDLSLQDGELLVVVGPNGSGKSTLLRLFAGLLSPQRGQVRLDGGPLDALPPRERARRLAVVPQALAALPETTVQAFVLAG